LTAAAAEMLGVEPALIEAALADGLASGRLVERRGPADVPLIYLTSIDVAERELARRLRALAAGGHPLAGIDPDRAVAWVEARIRLELAPAQREALRAAHVAKVLVITGGPGVGKTTLVQAIVRVFRARAAAGVTLVRADRAGRQAPGGKHRRRGEDHPPASRLRSASGGFRYGAERPLDTDVVVVDESSMLDVTLAWQLRSGRAAARRIDPGRDVDQLPSVRPGHGPSRRHRIRRPRVLPADPGVPPGGAQPHHRECLPDQPGQRPHIPEVGRDQKTDFYFVEAGEPPRCSTPSSAWCGAHSAPVRFRPHGRRPGAHAHAARRAGGRGTSTPSCRRP
jgi:exodeoxyribonuclease V alpha subunit